MAGERVLIVEDEAITGMDVREMLRVFGYKPHGPVVTGKAAVESALALRPELILMDIVLKGPMNGIQAAEVIGAQHPCPVIYLTGSSDRVKADADTLPQSFGFVLKPIDEEDLRTAIEAALHPHNTAPGPPPHDMPSEKPERMTV